MKTNFLKSPLRYPGGKSRAIKILMPFFPKDFDELAEPFFGGGSVGLYLAQNFGLKQIFANDLNTDLYCFWQTLKTQNKALIDEIKRTRQTHTNGRELYEKLLARRGENLSDFQRAVDFFVLNRITFSGVVDTHNRLMKAVLRQVALRGLKIWTAFCVILHSATKAMKVFCKTMEKEFLSFWTRHILVRANQSFMAKRAIYTRILTTSGCANTLKTQNTISCLLMMIASL